MKHKSNVRNSRRISGYALLEYCAGAAVIAGVIWVALDGLGASLADLLTALSDWALERTSNIRPPAAS